jgi:hypothetical protein
MKVLMRHVAAAGEPWQTFFETAKLHSQVVRLGFATVRDFGPDEINARFFLRTPARSCASAGLLG